MMSSPFAYVVALIVAICFLAAAIVAVILRAGNVADATPAITTLIGLFGPTLGVLVLLVRQQHNIEQTASVKEAVNGHLEAHGNGPNPPSIPPAAPGV